MTELELAVPSEAAGERLDRFLATVDGVGSRSEAERLLGENMVLVDGRSRPKSHRLAGGETVSLVLPDRRTTTLEPEELDLVVAWEDDYLLVVDKPAGLVVHPSAGHRRGTLVHGLVGHGVEGGADPGRPGIVHRLDRDTSGLLVVARDAETHRRLQRLLRRRELTREYLALVHGRPRSWRGRIEAPIGRDRRDPTRVSLDTDRPRDAVTHFEVAELLPRNALLRVRLETGRTHQIRVHLGAIDLPVSGDPVYGNPGDLGLERQFLHAARLAFVHPRTGAEVDVESPLPPDLVQALERARRA
jgi:23S rRNA pseudouridine1911/1915/1917 synthase